MQVRSCSKYGPQATQGSVEVIPPPQLKSNFSSQPMPEDSKVLNSGPRWGGNQEYTKLAFWTAPLVRELRRRKFFS